jgi:hemerythrin-like domain-containing protein
MRLFGSHVLHLMEEVGQHVEEEENVMFPEVEKQLLQGALADLGQCLQKRKQELMSMARNELRPRKAG